VVTETGLAALPTTRRPRDNRAPTRRSARSQLHGAVSAARHRSGSSVALPGWAHIS
jgi:hypothetical protein